MIDATHDKARRSWVASANGHAEFPIQNLPFGVFRPEGEKRRGGVAIGDAIFDLSAGLEAELFQGEAALAAEAAAGPRLNALMALGQGPRQALRKRISDILDAGGREAAKIKKLGPTLLFKAADCTLELPARIGDYTDFFAGIHHAQRTGAFFRPDNPLLPNYKHVPVAYHGRASSIIPSGKAVHRPQGQHKLPSEPVPSFGPSRNLDYELELGIWIGPGNKQGEPIAIDDAGEQIVGLCLLNDWSARDLQGWESQPLGPFLGKNFATTISPWIVTAEALAPFRRAQAKRPEGDPRPLDYLWSAVDQAEGAIDIALEALIMTSGLREKGLPPQRLSASNATDLYWTAAQMVAHHSSGGCNLEAGDIFGSGTISGAAESSVGSLLELTQGGRRPLTLASGETRRFLEDGDEVILRAACRRDGFVGIGFGDCRGKIVAAAA